nr:putative BPI/LBP family protein At1g04970 [Tanacetum cinerariifolium]
MKGCVPFYITRMDLELKQRSLICVLVIHGSYKGDKEGLWNVFAKLEASMKCWMVLVVPRHRRGRKEVTKLLSGHVEVIVVLVSYLGLKWLSHRGEDIAYAIEDTITSKVKEAVIQLDSVMQSLPKQVSFGDTATLNVTVTDGPIMSSTSLLIGIDGLFTQIGNEVTSGHYGNSLLSSSSVCNNPMKMVAISVHEDVLNSASLVYFNANKISWIVDNLPDQKLLNTSGWRFIIPKLYKEFPNDGMSLNFTILSPPSIKVENEGIVATVKSDVFINVVDAGEVIAVACITMVCYYGLIASSF